MKRSAYFTFSIKAICCAFLFGIVQVGCEKVDSSAVVEPAGGYQKLENVKETEKKLRENTTTLSGGVDDD